MGRIVAGLASSHALALVEPDDWDTRRQHTRANYQRRYGVQPAERQEVAGETLKTNSERHKRLRAALAHLRERLDGLQPDALILIGDDQDENFRSDNLPQFAIYTGESVAVDDRVAPEPQNQAEPHACDATLSRAILEGMIEQGFDLSSSRRLSGDRLQSHAHVQVLRYMNVPKQLPIVPIFVNSIHVPAPTPTRCYQFGEALRRVIESQLDNKRVVIYASGGLSHYTAGFPWPNYEGPATLGYIDVDFDRRAVDWMASGSGSELRTLSSKDILNSGNIEMRQWIMLMGALGDVKPSQLVYEPFFRGLMGMAAGCWELEKQPAPAISR